MVDNQNQLTEAERSLIALIPRLDERLFGIIFRLEKIEKETSEIKTQITKWKGALPIILAVGGIIGWLLTSIDKIKGLFS